MQANEKDTSSDPYSAPATPGRQDVAAHDHRQHRGSASTPAFAEFYRQDVESQLRAGAPHSTLGKNLKRGTFGTAGGDVFAKLQGYGLAAEMVCVDYGCGTLRVGQHIIRLLEAGAYWGLDISDYLLDEGQRLLGPKLMEDKRPNLRLISDESVAEVSTLRPDLVFANAVLMHVHPDEMDRFARHLVALTADRGQALFTVKCSRRTVRYSTRSWSHGRAAVDTAFAAHGASLEVLASEPSAVPGADDSRRYWIRLVRSAPSGGK